MQDKNYKKEELESFIWNLIKERNNLTLTGTDNNEIDARAELLELKQYEVTEIKENQLNKLEQEIARRQEEEKRKEQEAIQAREDEIREQIRIQKQEQEKQQIDAAEIDKKRKELEAILKGGLPKEDEPATEPPKPPTKLVLPITIFLIACLVGAAGFLFWKNNSKSTTNFSNVQPISTPSKNEQIPFQELMGEYVGAINNKEIKITILLEGQQTRYTYSENKSRSFRLTHFGKTNQINLFQPKENLGEFTIFKEGNTIILRSGNIELRKTK